MKSYIYRHAKKESISSLIVKRYLIAINRKDSIVRIFETKQFKHVAAPINRKLKKLCNIDVVEVQERDVTILKPLKNASNKVIFYAHGGAHMNNITSHHWRMLYYIIRRTGATVIVPDYPLIPHVTYKEVYSMMEEAFHKTISQVDNKDLLFVGDSAGGALSLALAQLLRDNGNPIQPSKLILISPELDATALHEKIPSIEKNDVMLSGEIFDKVYPHYVADGPRNHYLVSPGLGDISGLGKIALFTGTYDILFPYVEDFRDRLEEEGHSYHYYEYPKMMHVWTTVTAIKEAKSALNQMVNFINGED